MKFRSPTSPWRQHPIRLFSTGKRSTLVVARDRKRKRSPKQRRTLSDHPVRPILTKRFAAPVIVRAMMIAIGRQRRESCLRVHTRRPRRTTTGKKKKKTKTERDGDRRDPTTVERFAEQRRLSCRRAALYDARWRKAGEVLTRARRRPAAFIYGPETDRIRRPSDPNNSPPSVRPSDGAGAGHARESLPPPRVKPSLRHRGRVRTARRHGSFSAVVFRAVLFGFVGRGRYGTGGGPEGSCELDDAFRFARPGRPRTAFRVRVLT